MKKILILHETPFYKKVNGFDEIFARKSAIKGVKVNKRTKINITPDDLFSGKDLRMADHLAFIIEDKFYTKNFSGMKINYLKNFGGDKFQRYFIGRSLVSEIIKIVSAVSYAKRVIKYYGIKDSVYIYKKDASLQVLNFVENEIEEIKNCTFKIFRKYEYFLYDFYRRLGALPLFLTESIKNLIFSKNKQLNLKENYKIGVHLYPGLGFSPTQPMDYFIDRKKINKDDILFMIDYLFDDKWEKSLRTHNYQFLNFQNELLKSIRKSDYLKKYFITFLIDSLKSYKLLLFYPWLTARLYKHLKSKLYWNIFFDKTNIEMSFRAMMRGDLSSIIIQKNNRVKTNFFYFSTTSQTVDEKIHSLKSDCEDYSFMLFDNVISNNISNKWFGTLQNTVSNYINVKPIGSDIINYKKNIKKIIKNKININVSKVLVSCFDNSVGHGGMIDYQAYYKFWKDLTVINEMFPEHLFCIKTKKSWDMLTSIKDKEINNILHYIDKSNKWINAKDYKINTYDWISISDIVISLPVSSIIFESLHSGINTISYDPLNQYSQRHRPEENIDNLTAHNFNELQLLYANKINYLKSNNQIQPLEYLSSFKIEDILN